MNNKIATALYTIGITISGCGIIGAIIIWTVLYESGLLGLYVIIASLIVCVTFISLAEILNLLQKNLDMQKQILSCIKDKSSNEKRVDIDTLHDIESNLPKL